MLYFFVKIMHVQINSHAILIKSAPEYVKTIYYYYHNHLKIKEIVFYTYLFLGYCYQQ